MLYWGPPIEGNYIYIYISRDILELYSGFGDQGFGARIWGLRLRYILALGESSLCRSKCYYERKDYRMLLGWGAAASHVYNTILGLGFFRDQGFRTYLHGP